VSDKDKERLQVKAKQDGVFFMAFTDFCESFFCAYFAKAAPITTHCVFRVATEVQGSPRPVFFVTPPAGGVVEVLLQGQDGMGLYDDSAPSFTSKMYRTTASPKSAMAADLADQVGTPVLAAHTLRKATAKQGESIVIRCEQRSEACRCYLMINCPAGSKLTALHDGLGTMKAEEPPPEPEEPAEANLSLRSAVAKVGTMAGWDDDDEAKVLDKLVGGGITSVLGWASAVLDDTLNKKLKSGKKFGNGTLRHMKAVAQQLEELETAVKEVSEKTGWNEEDREKVVLKLVAVGILSDEDLVDVVFDGHLNNKLKGLGFQPLGSKSIAFLKGWATLQHGVDEEGA